VRGTYQLVGLQVAFPLNADDDMPFSAVDLPDLPSFCVITGRNGSGKTTLLQLIEKGGLKLFPIAKDRVKYFDPSNFFVSQGDSAHGTNAPAALEAYQFYVENKKERFQELYESLKALEAVPEGRDDFYKIMRREASNSLAGQNQNWTNYRIHTHGIQVGVASLGRFGQLSTQQTRSESLITKIIESEIALPHNISIRDFETAVRGFSIGNPLQNSLGAVFLGYLRSREFYVVQQCRSRTIVEKAAYEEFDSSNTAPWSSINSLLSKIRESIDKSYFNFEFVAPTGLLAGDIMDGSASFAPYLFLIGTGKQIPIEKISSGEKILLALCLLKFNIEGQVASDTMILLDEIDNSLHPSMIRAMLEILTDITEKSNCRVVLSTHSPTTVALSPPQSVFELSRDGRTIRVDLVDQDQAIENLSDGLFTVHKAVSILKDNPAKVVIMSEGHNGGIIKKFCSLHFDGRVAVVDGIESFTGIEQLHTIYQFVGSVAPKDRIHLFVLDSDADAKVARWQLFPGVEKICLNKCVGSLADRGIESSFSAEVLLPFSKRTTIEDYSGENTIVKFDPNRKKDFARHISTHGDTEHFSSFDRLKVRIEQLLEAP
jgi:energy-coupling factor transporter ATP-binding protein EcfA2